MVNAETQPSPTIPGDVADRTQFRPAIVKNRHILVNTCSMSPKTAPSESGSQGPKTYANEFLTNVIFA